MIGATMVPSASRRACSGSTAMTWSGTMSKVVAGPLWGTNQCTLSQGPASERRNFHAANLSLRRARRQASFARASPFFSLARRTTSGGGHRRLSPRHRLSPASISAWNWPSSAGLRSETAICAMPLLRQLRTL
jgi:hypothetical protein